MVKNGKVETLNQWEANFNDGRHWKEGRSAYSLAVFVLERDGLNRIAEILKPSLGDNVEFQSCDVEASVKFDNFPRPSQRDMVLIGKVNNVGKVFITVEAKVDESFGNKVSQIQNKGRLGDLLRKFSLTDFSDKQNLRYQLFHAAAATIEKGNYGQDFQKSVMLVLVFKTKGYRNDVDYNQRKGDKNYGDFCNFMKAIGASKQGDNEVWTLDHDGKEITFIYSYIEFPK